MKRADVKIGEQYLSRVSGALVTVTILEDLGTDRVPFTSRKKHYGFRIRNESTGTELVRSAAALRERKVKKLYRSCKVIRRIHVTTLSLTTGKETAEARWETKPCGIPLFGDDECKIGVCHSCQKGWMCFGNYPAHLPQPSAEVED